MTLQSCAIGVLPIVNKIIDRMKLESTLNDFLPQEDKRNKVPTSTALLLLIKNILVSREPLYGLGGTVRSRVARAAATTAQITQR